MVVFMPTYALPRAVGEFAASRHGALSRRQAATFGLKASAIRNLIDARLLLEVAPGVLVVSGTERGWRQQLMIASLCCKEVGAIGYESAAALQHMDGYAENSIALLLPSPRHVPIVNVTTHACTGRVNTAQRRSRNFSSTPG